MLDKQGGWGGEFPLPAEGTPQRAAFCSPLKPASPLGAVPGFPPQPHWWGLQRPRCRISVLLGASKELRAGVGLWERRCSLSPWCMVQSQRDVAQRCLRMPPPSQCPRVPRALREPQHHHPCSDSASTRVSGDRVTQDIRAQPHAWRKWWREGKNPPQLEVV